MGRSENQHRALVRVGRRCDPDATRRTTRRRPTARQLPARDAFQQQFPSFRRDPRQIDPQPPRVLHDAAAGLQHLLLKVLLLLVAPYLLFQNHICKLN